MGADNTHSMAGVDQPPPRPGDVLGGYEIESIIAAGGMGVVYRARQRSLGRIVALKVISPALQADEEFRRRFKSEARHAAAIDHPNVIPVYDYGESEGRVFMAMKLIEGCELKELLASNGPLSHPQAARILTAMANALDAAHATGLIHRDVKPSNVLVSRGDPSGHVYLVDFGLVKGASGGATITGSSQRMGSVGYMAPEQIRGDVVDSRTDIYSLGCVAFELLTGTAPFAGTDAQRIWAHMKRDPPMIPGKPAASFEITKAMSKDRADRHVSAGDFARAFEAARDPGPVSLEALPRPRGRRLADGPETPTVPLPAGDNRASRTPPPPPPTPPSGASAVRSGRSRWVGVALAGLLLAASGLAMTIAMKGGPAESQPSGRGSEAAADNSESNSEESPSNNGGLERTVPENEDAASVDPQAAPIELEPVVISPGGAPGFEYTVSLPSESGWTDPVASGKFLNRRLHQVETVGPEMTIAIDRTPFGEADTTAGRDRVVVGFQRHTGGNIERVAFDSSIDYCKGYSQCYDFLVQGADGSGWAVVVAGSDEQQVLQTGLAIANSIRPGA